jgi:hypothetical protein
MELTYELLCLRGSVLSDGRNRPGEIIQKGVWTLRTGVLQLSIPTRLMTLGGANEKRLPHARARPTSSAGHRFNNGGCKQGRQRSATGRFSIASSTSPHTGDSKMTGKLARLMVGTCMTAALTISGFAGSMPAAHATGKTGGVTCSVIAVCDGFLNGNTVHIETGDIKILNGNEINILTVNENRILNDVANIKDIQVQVDQIASENVVVLKDVLHLQVCQVKVLELGVVNLNIAKCN